MLVLPQVARRRIGQRGLGMQQQGQRGTLDVGLRGGVLAHHPLTPGAVLRGEGRLVGGAWSRHGASGRCVTLTNTASTLPQSLQAIMKRTT
jgi:hypothetical protein